MFFRFKAASVRQIFFCLVIITCLLLSLQQVTFPNDRRSDWLYSAKWGVFAHFLAPDKITINQWNKLVDDFDVVSLSNQLRKTGTKYFFVTVGQNSGFYSSPNSKYDKYTNSVVSKCSRRDLILDLSKALKRVGIKLLVYLPSGAPNNDYQAVTKLRWKSGPSRNYDFQLMWESIISEWSIRWGAEVSGWWFDGAKWPKAMYNFSSKPNFFSFAAAARAGNPESILAFNPGEPIINQTPAEDYTAGEINDPWSADCKGRFVGKAQYHLLSYLGSTWATGPKRFVDNEVVRITHNINKCGGVMTWDVPIESTGHIPDEYIDQLIALNQSYKDSNSNLGANGNLAFGKQAKLLNLDGTKELSVNSSKYFPRLGVDGIPSSFAMAGGEWPWTYQVDLSKISLIKRMVLTFGPGISTEFKISVSNDMHSWSTIAFEKGFRKKRYVLNFPPRKAQYVRIQSFKPDGPNQPGTQMSVSELEVY